MREGASQSVAKQLRTSVLRELFDSRFQVSRIILEHQVKKNVFLSGVNLFFFFFFFFFFFCSIRTICLTNSH